MAQSKLFLFGIGGTGSRVVKSLAFLLGAGVKVNASKIIPIIIDPDRANGDMNRTMEILRYYQRIRSAAYNSKSSFFDAEIVTLKDLVPPETTGEALVPPGFRFELNGVQNDHFRDFIDFNNLDAVNKALAGLLFSEDNLDADMEVGFKGNPNIGSVVLNQVKNSDYFRHFASNFKAEDRIFIISSIFGGTGAAGFPLVLKNIRNAGEDVPNFAFLRQAKIGAITILPYFGVAPDEKSKIDKATFISKSKAALSYYSRNVSGNDSLNALYYIGDRDTKDYENREGAAEQKNDAHFVEVAAALSVIDFMNMDDTLLQTERGRAINPIYKEFGIKEDVKEIHFGHLGSFSQSAIMKPLAKYQLMCLYLRDRLDETIEKHPWSNAGKIKIDKNFTTKPFYSDALNNYNRHFQQWLQELDRNEVKFSPLLLNVNEKNVYHLVKHTEPVKTWNPMAKKNYELFIDQLNDAEKDVGDLPVEQKFLSLFSTATENLVQKKFNW